MVGMNWLWDIFLWKLVKFEFENKLLVIFKFWLGKKFVNFSLELKRRYI